MRLRFRFGLGLRLWAGFFLIAGLAGFFILRVFVQEVRPSVRQVMEDVLVDTANILAELAHEDLAAMPAGGSLQHSRFASAVAAYAQRPVDAQIWGLNKTRLDYRVYLTDAAGRVVFDTGLGSTPPATGQDYSRWRDVALTLQGRYGARASREVATDEKTSVMVVAAPVLHQGKVIGVLSVAKPMSTVQPFVERAEGRIVRQGAWLVALSLVVGLGVTAWLVWAVRRLRRYAQQVQFGQRQAAPQLPGELGDLAQAMHAMRERLEDHRHIEHTVRALTHELKSPMAAIAGAAELLHDELPAADRQAFATQITQQVARQQALVERMLELARLEHMSGLHQRERLLALQVLQAVAQRAEPLLRQRGMHLSWLQQAQCTVLAERELLELALGNVLDNAIAFAPRQSGIELAVWADGGMVRFGVRDHGPGVQAFALQRLGERFLSTARPAAPGEEPRKGSGLGLAIAREVMALHGGSLRFEHASPGLRVVFELPEAR